ncbi:hypothetical protein ALC53_09471 [Atta colombica]|uniref:Uncharacterized protein n=1 Tax=Atta colombica TaxID=520822 RepID=A0A151I1F3_9HYME|nr:hypothetical protein ALC53_09471 [Atta colombica]
MSHGNSVAICLSNRWTLEQSRVKRPQLSIGIKSLIARIARLESFKDSVHDRFVQVGTGYNSIVLERVRDIMQRHNSIKINTIFNDEVITDDKRANKSITTRNYS